VTTLRLKVLTPTQVLLDVEAQKVIAEADNGFFCLLPHHIDFVAALVPGILYITAMDGQESFVAVDEGTLVKCDAEVLVSVLNAATGNDLTALEATVRESFSKLDVDTQRTRSALARLEAATMRQFLELEKRAHG
jgi:F-type H+-transporting ATPase subunit epsilon